MSVYLLNCEKPIRWIHLKKQTNLRVQSKVPVLDREYP